MFTKLLSYLGDPADVRTGLAVAGAAIANSGLVHLTAGQTTVATAAAAAIVAIDQAAVSFVKVLQGKAAADAAVKAAPSAPTLTK